MMSNSCMNFWLGIGLGAVAGIFGYRYSRTSQGMKMRENMSHAFHKGIEDAGCMMGKAKEKMMEKGKMFADKMSHHTCGAEGCTDEAKDMKDNKMNTATVK